MTSSLESKQGQNGSIFRQSSHNHSLIDNSCFSNRIFLISFSDLISFVIGYFVIGYFLLLRICSCPVNFFEEVFTPDIDGSCRC